MKKIFLLLLFIPFLNGCMENATEQFCAAMEHHPDRDENASIYMDNGICIVEPQDYNRTFLLDCDVGLLQRYKIDAILKTSDLNSTNLEIMDSLEKQGCKFMELK